MNGTLFIYPGRQIKILLLKNVAPQRNFVFVHTLQSTSNKIYEWAVYSYPQQHYG